MSADFWSPFYWVGHGDSASINLQAREYLADLFLTRKSEGFEGNGYGWTSLATVCLEENASALKPLIEFDHESGTFCAYSSDQNALRKFATGFKNACENREVINDIFSRAVLDEM